VKGWKVYPSSKKGFGSSLIENEIDNIFYVITGSDSEYKPISLKRIENVKMSFRFYRGKKIDVLIFVGRLFSEEEQVIFFGAVFKAERKCLCRAMRSIIEELTFLGQMLPSCIEIHERLICYTPIM